MGTPAEPQSPTGEITNPSDSGINPAWNEALTGIPEQFHNSLTPHFQKWDSEAQGKITELNGKVKSFEPYSPLIEHGITMEQVQQALLLNNEINTNPRAIYDALVQAYNFTNEAAKAPDPNNPDPNAQTNEAWKSEYEKMQQQMDLVSQIILTDQQAKEAAMADQKLDTELNAAMQKFPNVEFNKQTENYILSQMHSRGLSAEQAFQEFVDFRNSLQPAPVSPMVIRANGGGVPSQQIDPTQLSRQDTRNLVAQMLQAAAQQNR